jgi:nickel-dependent lactate racemase
LKGAFQIKLNYGKETVSLRLPEGIPYRILNIKDFPALEDIESAIASALRSPTGTKPLRELVKPGDKICLLVNDPTRISHSDIFLPYLVAELKDSGIRENDIYIVFASGSHRQLSQEEMAALVGPEIAATIPMYNHNSCDSEELVYLGKTTLGTPVSINRKVVQADWRILTGSIVFHFFAGFGGGRKALVPGVAGEDTIKANHSLMLHPQARSGVLKGNPLHEDLLEAAQMLDRNFLFNVVLNDHKEILGIFAGDIYQAHLLGCQMVSDIYGVDIYELADVVIAGCGGYPKDINLYQAQKTLENAAGAVKEGGQVVLLAQCPEGSGSQAFERWVCQYQKFEVMERALQENFELGGHKAYAVAKVLRKCTVHLVSQLSPNQALQWGFYPALSLDEAVERIYAGSGKNLLTYIMPQGSMTVPLLRT